MTPDFSQFNLAVLAPEVVLSIFALLVLLAGAFFPDARQRQMLPMLALAGVGVTGAVSVALWDKNAVFGRPETTIFVADNFALFFKWVFLISLGITILISGRFLKARGGDHHVVIGEYYGLLMLSTIGMMIVAGANDLLVVFLGIETLSIALYVLAGFARTRLMSNEASLKYFLLGAFATGFLLYGIALTYYAIGSTSLSEIADKVGSDTVRSPAMLFVGLALLLIGLGFKAALVPFHQWTPDVYEGSPTPVTAFMAVGAKAAAFAALLRVFPGSFGAMSGQWHNIVVVIAVLTMTVGNIVAISQNSVKRMLAYSSIAHAGYLLIGVLAAGSATRHGDPEEATMATGGVLFYMIVYALMNMGAFAVLVYLESEREAQDSDFDSEDANITMDDMNGLAGRQPLAAATLTVFMLSLAGIPPTAGFLGKLYIFLPAMREGLIGLLIVGVLNTVVSVDDYLRPVVAMYMQGGPEDALGAADGMVAGDGGAAVLRPAATWSLAVALAVGLCAVLILAMMVLQYVVLDWARQAAVIMPLAKP